jgi:hypothetical protein
MTQTHATMKIQVPKGDMELGARTWGLLPALTRSTDKTLEYYFVLFCLFLKLFLLAYINYIK